MGSNSEIHSPILLSRRITYFTLVIVTGLGIASLFFDNAALNKQMMISSSSSSNRSIDDDDASSFSSANTKENQQRYEYPPILYGHVHMAKTGGTTLNGMMANKYTRVCGHKGYSFDAYNANEIAKKRESKGERIFAYDNPSDRVKVRTMMNIGFHDCDWISHEATYKFWIKYFGDSNFFGIPMELHVPCREPLDHLMSYCNHLGKRVKCNHSSDRAFYKNIDSCLGQLKHFHRFDRKLQDHLDVKCYDFQKQFTTYINEVMDSKKLQLRRLPSDRYVQRETNKKRNKTNECIWERPDLQEKAKIYVINKYPYYAFCRDCLGSDNDLTK